MQSNFSDFSPVRPSAQSLEAEFARITQQHKRKSISTLLQTTATALLNFLTGQQTLSIKARQQADGEMQWIVYDPHTHQRQVFDSQQAVRTWLEERYHR